MNKILLLTAALLLGPTKPGHLTFEEEDVINGSCPANDLTPVLLGPNTSPAIDPEAEDVDLIHDSPHPRRKLYSTCANTNPSVLGTKSPTISWQYNIGTNKASYTIGDFFSTSSVNCQLRNCYMTDSGSFQISSGALYNYGLTISSSVLTIAETSESRFNIPFSKSFRMACYDNDNAIFLSGWSTIQIHDRCETFWSQVEKDTYSYYAAVGAGTTFSIDVDDFFTNSLTSQCEFGDCELIMFDGGSCQSTQTQEVVSVTYSTGTTYGVTIDTSVTYHGEYCIRCKIKSCISHTHWITRSAIQIVMQQRACSTILVATPDIATPQYYQLDPDGTIIYTVLTDYDVYTTSDVTCPRYKLELRQFTGLTNEIVADANYLLDSATGQLRISVSAEWIKTYYLRIYTSNQEYFVSTNQFTIDTSCKLTSTRVEHPAAGLTSPQTRYLGNGNPYYEVDYFITTQPICQITNYDPYQGASLTTFHPSFKTSHSDTGSKIQLIIKDSLVDDKVTYTFSLYVKARGGASTWGEIATVTDLQINVICGTMSTVVNYNGYPAPTSQYQDIQWVDINDLHTYKTAFVMATYTNSRSTCPIQQRLVTSTAGTFTSMISLISDPSDALVAGTYELTPTDKSIHRRYNFYIYFACEGGYIKYTNMKSLIVGCTSDVVINDNPTYTPHTAITLNVGDPGTDIFTFLAPTFTPTYCHIVSHSIVNINNQLNAAATFATTSISGLSMAASCGSTLPCSSLDINSIADIQVITFNMRTLLDGQGHTHDSPLLRINMVCTSTSTTMTSSVAASTTYLQFDSTNNVFSFDPFVCQYRACCISMNYRFVQTASTSGTTYDTTLMSAPTLDTDPASATYNKMISTVNIANRRTNTFWVEASNEYGYKHLTSQVKVIVTYNCAHDTIVQNQIQPASGTETYAVNYTMTLGYPVLVLSQYSDSIKTNNIPLENRWTNAYGTNCPISQYEIFKVVNSDGDEITTYGGLFKVDASTGSFLIYSSGFVYENYKVWVRAGNTDGVWSDPTVSHMVDNTILAPVYAPPNSAPYFATPLTPVTIELNITTHTLIAVTGDGNPDKSATEVKIALPEVLDANFGDKYTLSVTGPIFVTSDNTHLIFDLEKVTKQDLGTRQITLTLVDVAQAKKSYSFSYTLDFEVPVDFTAPNITVEGDPEPEDEGPENVQAFIATINQRGNMTIQFNTDMATTFNWSLLNSSNVDIYVRPANNREFDSGFKMTDVNFTWAVSFFEPRFLHIQLDFLKPTAISPLVDQDKIVFALKPEAVPLLISTEYNEGLHKNYQVLESKLKRQMPNSKSSENFESATSTLESSMRWLFLSSFLLNIFIGGALSYMLLFIRSLQLVIHLPIFHVLMPANVILFYKSIMPFAKFDLLDNDMGLNAGTVLTFDEEKQRSMQADIYDQMVDLGYDSHNSIMNLGTMAFVVMWYLIQVAVFYFVRFLNKNKLLVKGRQVEEHLKKKLFYGDLISVFIEGYIEFVISGYLNIESPVFSTFGEIVASLLAFFCMAVSIFVLPAIMIHAWKQPLYMFKSERFTRKWGAAYKDVSLIDKQKLFYYPAFVFRRMAYLGVAFFMFKRPLGQIIFLLFSSIGNSMYLGHSRPLIQPRQMYIENINEWFVFAITLHLVLFTDFVLSATTQFGIGWSMIIFIIINFIINLYFFLQDFCHLLSLLYKRYMPVILAWLRRLWYLLMDVDRFKPLEQEKVEIAETKDDVDSIVSEEIVEETTFDRILNSMKKMNAPVERFMVKHKKPPMSTGITEYKKKGITNILKNGKNVRPLSMSIIKEEEDGPAAVSNFLQIQEEANESDDGRLSVDFRLQGKDNLESKPLKKKKKNWDKPWERNPYTQRAEEVDLGSKKPTLAEMKDIIERKYYEEKFGKQPPSKQGLSPRGELSSLNLTKQASSSPSRKLSVGRRTAGGGSHRPSDHTVPTLSSRNQNREARDRAQGTGTGTGKSRFAGAQSPNGTPGASCHRGSKKDKSKNNLGLPLDRFNNPDDLRSSAISAREKNNKTQNQVGAGPMDGQFGNQFGKHQADKNADAQSTMSHRKKRTDSHEELQEAIAKSPSLVKMNSGENIGGGLGASSFLKRKANIRGGDLGTQIKKEEDREGWVAERLQAKKDRKMRELGLKEREAQERREREADKQTDGKFSFFKSRPQKARDGSDGEDSQDQRDLQSFLDKQERNFQSVAGSVNGSFRGPGSVMNLESPAVGRQKPVDDQIAFGMFNGNQEPSKEAMKDLATGRSPDKPAKLSLTQSREFASKGRGKNDGSRLGKMGETIVHGEDRPGSSQSHGIRNKAAAADPLRIMEAEEIPPSKDEGEFWDMTDGYSREQKQPDIQVDDSDENGDGGDEDDGEEGSDASSDEGEERKYSGNPQQNLTLDYAQRERKAPEDILDSDASSSKNSKQGAKNQHSYIAQMNRLRNFKGGRQLFGKVKGGVGKWNVQQPKKTI